MSSAVPLSSPETQREIARIIALFPKGKQKSALIRILHIAQEENGGYLTAELMDKVADLLDIKPIEVYEVATFYTMFNHEPIGKYMLEFCHTGPCCCRGVEGIIHYTEQKLGIKAGETTPDGMFTIKTVECLGACGYAPMMQVGEFYHENLTPEKIDQFIADCRAGRVDKGSWIK